MTLDGVALGMTMDEVRALRGAPDREHFSLENGATVWAYGNFPVWFREAEEVIRIDGQRLERDGLRVGVGDSLEQAQAVLGAVVPRELGINWDRKGIRSFQLRELQAPDRVPRPLDEVVDGLRSDQYYRRIPEGVYVLPHVEALRVQQSGVGLPVLVADGLRIGRLTVEPVLSPGDVTVRGRFEDDFLIEAVS